MRICVVVTGNSFEDFLENLEKAQEISDFIELRADFIPNIDEEALEILKEFTTKECIFTCRSKNEGGHFDGTDNRRLWVLDTALKLGFDYLDIELSSAENFFNSGSKKRELEQKKTKLILSFHDLEKTPVNFEEILKKMEHWNPDIFKIVTTPNSSKDVDRIYKFILQQKGLHDIICFGLGELGTPTRIVAPMLGSWCTFGALDEKNAFDGQLTTNELQKNWNSLQKK